MNVTSEYFEALFVCEMYGYLGLGYTSCSDKDEISLPCRMRFDLPSQFPSERLAGLLNRFQEILFQGATFGSESYIESSWVFVRVSGFIGHDENLVVTVVDRYGHPMNAELMLGLGLGRTDLQLFHDSILDQLEVRPFKDSVFKKMDLVSDFGPAYFVVQLGLDSDESEKFQVATKIPFIVIDDQESDHPNLEAMKTTLVQLRDLRATVGRDPIPVGSEWFIVKTNPGMVIDVYNEDGSSAVEYLTQTFGFDNQQSFIDFLIRKIRN